MLSLLTSKAGFRAFFASENIKYVTFCYFVRQAIYGYIMTSERELNTALLLPSVICADQTKETDVRLRVTLKNDDESCSNPVLCDDLILCRFSALLFPTHKKISKEQETIMKAFPSECMSPDSVFMLIPSDICVVLPPVFSQSSRDGAHTNSLESVFSAIGIEEVEALNPLNGGPSTGQCQFACLASSLSSSFGVDHPLCEGYRPDLELRRLALHTIRMNADMYRDFLTVVSIQ